MCDRIRALDIKRFFETLINMIDELGYHFD